MTEEELELRSLRVLVEQMGRELSVVQTVLATLNKSLFGNGQPGIIERIENKVNRHDKWIYIATGAIVTMQFLSGSGLISLKGLLGR